MPWAFGNYESAYYPNANFLDAVSQFTYVVTCRLDNDHLTYRQAPFGHYGTTSRAYFRKNNTSPELMRWSVTTGSVSQTVDDTWTIATGEPHQWALTWKKADSTGMQLYRDGAFVAQSSTVAQTADYNTGGAIPLYVGAISSGTYFFEGTVETLMAFPGSFLTADQIASLAEGVPWFDIGGVPRPAVWWDFLQDVTTSCRDASGNNRGLTSSYIHAGVSGVARFWRYQTPHIGRVGMGRAAATTGVTPPSDWTLWEEVFEPVAASAITGLTNGTTYEVSISAVDDDGNESAKCTAAEATPSVPPTPVVAYRIPWKKAGRRSKYRSAQQ
jgi:hypothetical protein